ncbi:MAG: 4-hydroxythreonine-4-phosphate dehydrogenase PdxA [Flavobacteriales bacterium]|nr:4-hydroxythreonine-4-phosphate dehydrogenase PdxA [Flavobacteriales bacterium]
MVKIKVGISVGDLNGIGMEVIIKTFLDNRMMELCTPIVFGGAKTASYHRKALEIKDFSFNIINKIKEVNAKRANLLNCWNEEVEIKFGEATEIAGKYAFKSLTEVTDSLKNKEVDVLVTAPINKANIQKNESSFIGHTEYLGQQFDGDSLMIMLSDTMRIAFVTGHIPLSEVAASLSEEKIFTKIEQLSQSLIQDFGISKPKIAVIGLNPHAGENGMLGKEEKEIISPTISKAKKQNILAFGPYSADSFFTKDNLKNFDGVLAMYHDQGLTPFKTLSFSEGVNYTAGLSIIIFFFKQKTAYDIAGKNCADEKSFRNAVYMACDIYRKREEYKGLISNPLLSQNS